LSNNTARARTVVNPPTSDIGVTVVAPATVAFDRVQKSAVVPLTIRATNYGPSETGAASVHITFSRPVEAVKVQDPQHNCAARSTSRRESKARTPTRSRATTRRPRTYR
jgi:hypothetical protein